MSSFVIVGTQRSGTTLLRSSMDNHPQIQCLGEVFYINPELKDGAVEKRGKGLEDSFSSWRNRSYQNFMARSWRHRLGHWLFRNKLTSDYLDEIFGTCELEACGFKLMANQFKRFPAVLDYIKRHQVRVIHMHRANPMDIHLSRLSMIARGFAHASVDLNDNLKIEVPVSTLVDDLVAIDTESRYWELLLSEQVPYLKVTYEEFVNNRKQSSFRILDFIGVDSSVSLESSLKKLNKRMPSELISNYDDVIAELSGSQYEDCLC